VYYYGDHPADALGRYARRLYGSGAMSLGGGVGVERQGQRDNPSYAVVNGTKPARKFSGPLQAITVAFGIAGGLKQEGTPGGTVGISDPVRAARVWELEGVIRQAEETLERYKDGNVIPSLRSDYAENRRQEATRDLQNARRERAKLLKEALAESAVARLDVLEAELGEGVVERLLAGEHRKRLPIRPTPTQETVASQMDQLAAACADDLDLIEAADLPRHRDGKWSNLLRQRKRKVPKRHPALKRAA
jgi:hypothetical protein